MLDVDAWLQALHLPPRHAQQGQQRSTPARLPLPCGWGRGVCGVRGRRARKKRSPAPRHGAAATSSYGPAAGAIDHGSAAGAIGHGPASCTVGHGPTSCTVGHGSTTCSRWPRWWCNGSTHGAATASREQARRTSGVGACAGGCTAAGGVCSRSRSACSTRCSGSTCGATAACAQRLQAALVGGGAGDAVLARGDQGRLRPRDHRRLRARSLPPRASPVDGRHCGRAPVRVAAARGAAALAHGRGVPDGPRLDARHRDQQEEPHAARLRRAARRRERAPRPSA